jgi:glutathione synthase/RimK-type ligase-like ATP-grasp enzyme
MKKNLVYYGYIPDWTNIFNKKALMCYLDITVNDILLFRNISGLKKYLKNDGLNYKNYIFPIKIENIVELNEAGIKSLFEIDSNSLQQFNDKKLFVEYAKENNLLDYIPKCYLLPSNSNELVIVKPKVSYYSIGVYTKFLRDVKPEEFIENVVQKYIYDPDEYAGYFVCHNGKITHGFAYVSNYGEGEFIKNKGGKWDETPQVKVNLTKYIIDTIQKFLQPCSYTGLCSVDFKISNNHLYIFEINPRLGGSLNDKSNRMDLVNVILELMRIYDERNVFN